jgi:hypothetical protein
MLARRRTGGEEAEEERRRRVLTNFLVVDQVSKREREILMYHQSLATRKLLIDIKNLAVKSYDVKELTVRCSVPVSRCFSGRP